MNPEDAVALYVEHSRQRHLADETIQAQLLELQRLSDYCRQHSPTDLREATPDTLLDYHRWLRRRKRPDGQPLSTTYINGHVRLAKALFKFLADRHYIMTDISRSFPPLHDPKTLPRGILNKDQVLQLLQQPFMTTPLGFRDRTMFEVLYSTGLRGGELCRLTLYDFDSQERMIRVNAGKGKKDRVVPIGKVAAGYLVEYIKRVRPLLAGGEQRRTVVGEQRRTMVGEQRRTVVGEQRRTRGETHTAWIFLSATGRRLRTGDLHRLIKCYRGKAGLPETITTHSLRHTCATELLKGGASIRHVQELLGHADIRTTQIYTHVVPIELKKAHARTAPSERRTRVEPVAFAVDGAARWNDNRNARYWKLRKRLETGAGNG